MHRFMEKLLEGATVEWRKLGEVAEIRSGWGFPNSYQGVKEGKYPFYKVSDMNLVGNEMIMSTANNYIDDDVVKKLKISPAPIGTIIFPKIGAAVATNKKRLLSFPSAYDNNVMGLIPGESVMPRFLFYWMQTINLSTLANDSGAVPSIRKSTVEAHLIPIPPLEVQREIVRILDNFTELTAELTAELSARRKQYSYYRDQLLSFGEDEVEWKKLGEVASIGTGKHDTQDAVEDGKYIFYARGREPLRLNSFDFDETAIITAGDGVGVGKVFHYAKGKYALHQRAYRIVPKMGLESRFVYHYIVAYFYTYIQKASVNSSVTSLRRPMFLNFPIPNPPLKKQKEIVAILDKFDTLTNSITEGLPREIELREKQYAYYRDLLLDFPKEEVEV